MEKLNSHATYGRNFYGDVGCTGTSAPSNDELMLKINELIDEVNNLKNDLKKSYDNGYSVGYDKGVYDGMSN